MKIIKRYVIDVMEDHSIVIREQAIEMDNEIEAIEIDNEIKTSERISQVLQVLAYVKENMARHSSLDVALTTGINTVAEKLKIRRQTVTDKLARQMDLKMENYPKLLDEWLNKGESDELKELLLKHISKGSEDADTKSINEFFK